jgi:hypothetical protein
VDLLPCNIRGVHPTAAAAPRCAEKRKRGLRSGSARAEERRGIEERLREQGDGEEEEEEKVRPPPAG